MKKHVFDYFNSESEDWPDLYLTHLLFKNVLL